MNFRPLSLVNRRVHARHFGGWLKAQRVPHLKVDDQVAGRWVSWVVTQESYSDHYKSAMLATIRTFYRWLRLKRLIRDNPFDGMGRFRLKETLPKVCTEKDVLKLIKAAKTPLERAVIEILYATGCRVSELCSIDLKDVSLDARHIKILGKWRRERMVLFNAASVRAIKEFLVIRSATLKRTKRYWESALLVGQAGTRIRPVAVQKIVRRLTVAAGISSRVTPHVIRHSFATHLLNHGADLFTIMRLMGHKSLQATVRYLQLATARLAEVYKKCHPRK
jgi:site-specific recombinase XerD